MTSRLRLALALSTLFAAAGASAQITFYQGSDFRGRAYSTSGAVQDFGRNNNGINDRASSVVVDRGRWEVCEDARFRGKCVVLRRGSYDSLAKLGMENRISSVRPADNRRRYENEADVQMEQPNYAYRQRPSERTHEARVTSARAVMGPATQRCWVEQQQVSQPASNQNLGGAVVGGLLGGILGHQVGGGSGKQIATVAGAVGGAVVGSSIAGRHSGGSDIASTRDVQRCDAAVAGTPAYYDVTYNFRGREHQVQMSAPPGRTVVVNDKGEPRQ